MDWAAYPHFDNSWEHLSIMIDSPFALNNHCIRSQIVFATLDALVLATIYGAWTLLETSWKNSLESYTNNYKTSLMHICIV